MQRPIFWKKGGDLVGPGLVAQEGQQGGGVEHGLNHDSPARLPRGGRGSTPRRAGHRVGRCRRNTPVRRGSRRQGGRRTMSYHPPRARSRRERDAAVPVYRLTGNQTKDETVLEVRLRRTRQDRRPPRWLPPNDRNWL